MAFVSINFEPGTFAGKKHIRNVFDQKKEDSGIWRREGERGE